MPGFKFTLAGKVQCYVGESLVSRPQQNKVHCYLATRSEVQGFRDQGLRLLKISRDKPDLSYQP